MASRGERRSAAFPIIAITAEGDKETSLRSVATASSRSPSTHGSSRADARYLGGHREQRASRPMSPAKGSGAEGRIALTSRRR